MNDRSLYFKGTHREIGRQVGEQYKKWGKKEVYIPKFAGHYFKKQLSIYEKYFPKYIEYLEGIALGLNILKDKVLLSYLTGFLHSARTKPKNNCSVFVIKNNFGVLIGRNYDWLESSEKISSLLTYKYTDDSVNSFTGITDMATWEMGKFVPTDKFVIMIDDAWNEKGLYIALNGAPGNGKDFGMCLPHLIQCIIENCDNTAEAIKLISNIPIDDPKIFTIADRNNNFAVVERSHEKGTFIRQSNDYIFTTNHFNHLKLISENLSIFDQIPFHSTFARYHFLEYYLRKEKNRLNLDSIIKLLNKPPLTQNWRGIKNGDIMTIWTYGLNLSTQKYFIEFAPILKEKAFLKN